MADSSDCNDANGSIFPGATEVCNEIDDNCDGQTDEGVTTTFYADTDSDGFGDLAATTEACAAPIGFVADSSDCNDANANEHPGQTWYEDNDSDGYGNTGHSLVACSQPTGHVLNGTDWDDTDPNEWRDTDGDEVGDNADAFPYDANEWADTDGDGTGDQADTDDDNDELADIIELIACTNSLDADTDDDGIIDGYEDLNIDGVVDAAETDPCNSDSDADGVQDGTELGFTSDDIGPFTDPDVFQPDADPSTTTDPLVADTDRDGLIEGEEDTDQNGMVGADETDPLNVDTDGDGVFDGSDDLPLNPDESVDTDGDGIGDNGDLDDDNDGMPDEWEVLYGFDPLNDDASADPDGDEYSNLEEYTLDRHPTNHEPATPSPLLPINTSSGIPLTTALQVGNFSDADDDKHWQTRWQISRVQDDFSETALVLDVLSDAHLTVFNIPDLMLDLDSVYYWRAKFHDARNAKSDWSATFSFKTILSDPTDMSPQNNIPDDLEIDDADMDLDGNGTADINQPDMKCLHTGHNNTAACVKSGTNVSSVKSLMWNDPGTIADTENKPDNMPIGLLSFKLEVANPGDIAEVTVFCAEKIPDTWYKYDSVNKWQDYSVHATYNSDNSVTLRFKDGEFGDADGTKNRYIVDPSGPGTFNSSAPTNNTSPYVDSGGGGGGCFIASSTYEVNLPLKIAVAVLFIFLLFAMPGLRKNITHKKTEPIVIAHEGMNRL